MTFLHPWAIWIGVAAAGLPVAVHFLTRPRPTRMPLSTLRFVREAVYQRRARHRLRDIVLLVLRTLAVLLLALAVAQPQWGGQPLVSERQEGDAVRVVLLDVSQSMAAADHGIEAIERARTIAASYLRYRPLLQANLILAAAAPKAVFDAPSTNFDALRDELTHCQALPQRLDAQRALDLAADMLAPAGENDRRRRELVIVADFQRASWAKADFGQLPADTQIQLESTATTEPPANLAILRAEVRSQNTQGGGAQLIVEIGNFSPTPRRATVEVAIGQSTWRLEAVCPAGRITTLSDDIELRRVGWQSGEARLVGVDDALAADNVYPFVVRVKTKPVYALVTGQKIDLRPSSSHFLQCALVPEDADGKDASGRVIRLDPADMDATALATADLILLDHPGKLSDEAIQLLCGLLHRGRPVIYVASELIDATNLKRLGDAAGGGLRMPVEFSPPPAGQPRRNLSIVSARREEPPFRVFGDNIPAVLGQLRFAGGLSSRRLENALEEEELATYSDGSACMVCTSSEAGALAVLNADLAASNLPKTAMFVPLVNELVLRMLERNHRDRPCNCGEPLVVRLPSEAGAAAGLQIAAMDNTNDNNSQTLGELADEGPGTTWRWNAPQRPGVYSVRRGDDSVFSLSVNLPGEESDLESLPPEVLRDRMGGGKHVYYHRAFGESERSDDAWKWFAAVCVACMIGEIGAMLAFKN
jgi:hypothetical protein